MTVQKLETVMVYSSHSYALQLNAQIQVKQIATYLSNYEAHVDTATLEIAYPIQRRQRLQDIDMRAGDRLVMFTQATRQAALPAPLRAGDKILKFASGQFEIQTHSKQGIVVGKPDDARQAIPDVDLRYFIAPNALPAISRECVHLRFEDSAQVWYASRMGNTRVMINEFELVDGEIPINAYQVMRFYRETDDPQHARPLGEMTLTVESAQVQETPSNFMMGDFPVMVCVGGERGRQILRASEQWHIGNLMERLASYHHVSMTQTTRFYLLRLIAPTLTLRDVNLPDGCFLYAPLSQHYAQNFLTLRDVHQPERVYTLSVGNDDEEKRLGCRANRDVADVTLDVDLYDALIIHGHDLRIFQQISRYQARIYYRASGNTWWIRAEDHASTPIYINNTRLSSSASIQLVSGDVLTMGQSVDHYYARMELAMTSQGG